MPQLSSTDRLLMTANDMKDASSGCSLQYSWERHNNFTDNIISHFQKKYNKTPAPDLIDSPIKAAENKHPAVLIQPVLTSPIKHTYQTRSQKEVNKVPAHVSEYLDSSQLLRLVTPATRITAPPRVPSRARNLSPPETCPNETSGT
jgi:hypothetical protein